MSSIIKNELTTLETLIETVKSFFTKDTISKPLVLEIPEDFKIYEPLIRAKTLSSYDKNYSHLTTERLAEIKNLILKYRKLSDLCYTQRFYSKRNSCTVPFENIFLHRKAKIETKNTLVFSAHHDVVNPQALNILDNTGSVINLLEMIKDHDFHDDYTDFIFLFNDLEESGMDGARMFAKTTAPTLTNLLAVIVLELSLTGEGFFIERTPTIKDDDFIQTFKLAIYDSIYSEVEDPTIGTLEKIDIYTPPSDAYAFRSSGITSFCIGTYDLSNPIDSSPREWRLIHSQRDDASTLNIKHLEYFQTHFKRAIRKTLEQINE